MSKCDIKMLQMQNGRRPINVTLWIMRSLKLQFCSFADMHSFCMLVKLLQDDEKQQLEKTYTMTCASAQSDQSFRCPHEDSLGPWLSLQRKSKTLIRLGGCPG